MTYQRRQVRHERAARGVAALLEALHVGAVVDALRGEARRADEGGEVVEEQGAHVGRLADVALLAGPARVDDGHLPARRAVRQLVRVLGRVVAPGEAGPGLQDLGPGVRLDDGGGAQAEEEGQGGRDALHFFLLRAVFKFRVRL